MHTLDLAGPYALSPSPVRARHELQALLQSAAWDGDVDAVVLAVHEALSNSHRHGGGVRAASVKLDGEQVVVEVRDGGPPFDARRHTHRPPDPYAERGRGLWLISQIAQSWEVHRQRGENRLQLRFRP